MAASPRLHAAREYMWGALFAGHGRDRVGWSWLELLGISTATLVEEIEEMVLEFAVLLGLILAAHWCAAHSAACWC